MLRQIYPGPRSPVMKLESISLRFHVEQSALRGTENGAPRPPDGRPSGVYGAQTIYSLDHHERRRYRACGSDVAKTQIYRGQAKHSCGYSARA